MTVGELVYKQAIEQGYNPNFAKGLVSPLNNMAETYSKLHETLQGPMKQAVEVTSSVSKMIGPHIETMNRVAKSLPKMPTLSEIPSYLYEEKNEFVLPALTRPVHDVRIVNAEDIAVPVVKEESVSINAPHTLSATTPIFYLKGDDIYHYKIGRLTYRPRGLNDPKYIKAFKNVIRYMPPGTKVIRIKELESAMDKQDKIGQNYRMNIGKSARSFKSFLIKNGVINSHPVHKEVIIAATDEYITFHNFIESE